PGIARGGVAAITAGTKRRRARAARWRFMPPSWSPRRLRASVPVTRRSDALFLAIPPVAVARFRLVLRLAAAVLGHGAPRVFHFGKTSVGVASDEAAVTLVRLDQFSFSRHAVVLLSQAF